MTENGHSPGERYRRGDVRRLVERDKKRLSRRQPSSFWSSLALIGSVGWPIALSAVGGIWLGRYLDAAWGTGVRATLVVVLITTITGTLVAYRSIKGDGWS